jgi:response regulator RpfG family c-di-GMP phosphodiesterase
MPSITEEPAPQDNIMVVDDNPANLKLLEDMRRRQRYEVRSFPLGRLALAAADQKPPDLILLFSSRSPGHRAGLFVFRDHFSEMTRRC